MKTRLGLIGAFAALVVAAAPATASANRIRHEGELVGVASTKVKFAVTKRDGNLKRIGTMRFRNVPVSCADGTTGLINVNGPGFLLKSKRFGRRAKLRGPEIENGRMRVSGRLRRGGKAARGQLSASWQTPAGVDCGTGKQGWKTRKSRR